MAAFPAIPNPLFPFGPPFIDAVSTGIAHSDGQLLVTLFRGFPFPPYVSVVEQVDPMTGSHTSFITGLKTAIDVIAMREGSDTDYLALQHTSGVGPPFLPPFLRPGFLLRFETPAGPPTVIADCLNRPTSMTLDEKTGTVYVTERVSWRLKATRLKTCGMCARSSYASNKVFPRTRERKQPNQPRVDSRLRSS